MGIFIASSAQNSGHAVYWASENRSSQTRARADTYNLHDAKTLANLCATCAVIVSVCPPDAAEQLATQVAAQSFKGLYIDANAISPQRANRMGQALQANGARFVDGGIIGGPDWNSTNTWLFLSGEDARESAALFTGGPIRPRVIDDVIGKASALKMCYSAYSKGTTALLCTILATAQELGVRDELNALWSADTLDAQAEQRAKRVAARAWRFAGEMEEIANTFRGAGLPGEFHQGAAEIYRRMAKFKDAPTPPSIDQVLQALIQNSEQER
jgi:3-hydroxyisobutyrate dehydrogenase-like beta-hydroxyacid dehydrogenase